ncbi:hypothetical protein [uncultured Idiomarina sp.]|uniref:hypothetical protein n=1 Tax=uncultured Idiomarina sp. TaxID=352961 RepID=UPI0032B13D2D|tara:strand:+ start:2431 stop:2814 length:384 start_codon:yes stop_codon:yes gene_type:complete
MRITQVRLNSVSDGMIVKFNSENKLEAYDNVGDVAGIATNCREVQIQNDPEQPAIKELVCELVIDGLCDILLDSVSSSQGVSFGASTSRPGHAVVNGLPNLGKTAPRPWSNITEYSAGLVPALISID